jgi:Rad3-related DNA helicase
LARIIRKDLKGKDLRFNYEAKNLNQQYLQVGQIISQLSPKILGGILVFFTSYSNLNDCLAVWKNTKIDFGGRNIFTEDKEY